MTGASLCCTLAIANVGTVGLFDGMALAGGDDRRILMEPIATGLRTSGTGGSASLPGRVEPAAPDYR
jgi:hypothetical protein